MASSSGTCPSFPECFGITPQAFQDAFDDPRDGTYRLKPKWSLAFTHAVLTTGDRATTIATPVRTGSAGELWKMCTGNSVTKVLCLQLPKPTLYTKQSTTRPRHSSCLLYVSEAKR